MQTIIVIMFAAKFYIYVAIKFFNWEIITCNYKINDLYYFSVFIWAFELISNYFLNLNYFFKKIDVINATKSVALNKS